MVSPTSPRTCSERCSENGWSDDTDRLVDLAYGSTACAGILQRLLTGLRRSANPVGGSRSLIGGHNQLSEDLLCLENLRGWFTHRKSVDTTITMSGIPGLAAELKHFECRIRRRGRLRNTTKCNPHSAAVTISLHTVLVQPKTSAALGWSPSR